MAMITSRKQKPAVSFALSAFWPIVIVASLHFIFTTRAYDAEVEWLIEKELLNKEFRGKLIPQTPLNMKLKRKDACVEDEHKCRSCYNFAIRGFFSEFKYEGIIPSRSPRPIIERKTFHNNCSEYMMAQAFYSLNHTHVYSWSFAPPLDYVMYIAITAGFPSPPWGKLAKDKKKGSNNNRDKMEEKHFGGISYGPGANQFVTFQEDIVYEDYQEIVLPPFSSRTLSVHALWTPPEPQVAFTATVEFSTCPFLVCTTCPGNGSSWCTAQTPSARGVEEFLIQNEFDGRIVDRTEDYVKAIVPGVFRGDYGEKVETIIK